MSHFKEKHKDYLINNGIKTEDDLVIYLDILRNSRNSPKEDRQMLMDFAWLLINEKSSVSSFFAENKNPSKEFYNAFKQTTSSPTFMDEVLEQSNKEKWNPLNELHERAGREMFNTIKDEDGQFNSTRQGETHTEVPNFEVDYTQTTGYKDTEKFILLELNKLPKYKETDDKELLNDYVTKIIGNNPPFRTVEGTERQGEFATMEEMFSKAGKKESQTVKKAPIFTFCKQMKNAVEKLALRSLYGHEKYEKGDDWSNFARVPNADFEYSNSQFRHALEIGGEETEEEHLTASAWNAISRLEIYLRNKVK